MDVKDKIAVVTGASQGLGQKMALHLVEQGAKVALLDVGDLSETQTACEMLGGEVHPYTCNVTDEEQVTTTFNTIIETMGPIAVLVNNAGILKDGMFIKAKDGEITTMSYEQFTTVMDVNVNGTFLCGRAAASLMISSGQGGVIINISSIARAGNVGQTNYSASKAAVAAMTVVWAKELGRHGIRVGAIAPGVVETAMTSAMKPEARERLTKMVPVGHMAQPDHIADGMQFIIVNDYFSGRVLELDGGLRL